MTTTPLEQIRLRAGLTQAEFARRLKHSERQIHRWVNGTKPIPAHRREIVRRLKALGVKTTEEELWPTR